MVMMTTTMVMMMMMIAEDWFNTYLGCLQYVPWCTNVLFMFVHIVVTIGSMTF